MSARTGLCIVRNHDFSQTLSTKSTNSWFFSNTVVPATQETQWYKKHSGRCTVVGTIVHVKTKLESFWVPCTASHCHSRTKQLKGNQTSKVRTVEYTHAIQAITRTLQAVQTLIMPAISWYLTPKSPCFIFLTFFSLKFALVSHNAVKTKQQRYVPLRTRKHYKLLATIQRIHYYYACNVPYP